MGEAKRQQVNDKAFISLHPFCAYCGEPATTVDHMPPRAFFQRRIWPDNYRFPCCGACNDATRTDELVVAALASTNLQHGVITEQSKRLLKGLLSNKPDVARELLHEPSRNELRRRLRSTFGDALGDQLRAQGYTYNEIGEATGESIRRFGNKLFRALYYLHVGRQADGMVAASHLSGLEHNKLINTVLNHCPSLERPSRGRVDLSSQFGYRFNASSDLGVFQAVVFLGEQFVYFGNTFSKSFQKFVAEQADDGLALIEGVHARLGGRPEDLSAVAVRTALDEPVIEWPPPSATSLDD